MRSKALGSRRDKYECQTLKNIEKILELDTSQIFAGPCTVNSTLGKFRTNRDEFYSFTGNLHFSWLSLKHAESLFIKEASANTNLSVSSSRENE